MEETKQKYKKKNYFLHRCFKICDFLLREGGNQILAKMFFVNYLMYRSFY